MRALVCAIRAAVGLAGVALLLAGLSGGAAASSAGAPEAVFRGVAHDTLYALGGEGEDLVAVGDFGLILESDDGGRHWNRQEHVPTDAALLAVTRRAGRCIAVGQEGEVVHADDCRQWQRAEAPTEARLLAVDVNATGTGYAVGAFGTVLRTADWGRSWQPLSLDWEALTGDWAEPHLYDVQVDGAGTVTLVGEFELVIRSSDGGTSWQRLHQGRRSLFGLASAGNGHLVAVGQEGLILTSADDGATWRERPSGTGAILTDVWARPGGRMVAVGIYTILESDDGGASWHADRSEATRSGWHLAVTGAGGGRDPSHVVVVGSGATVLSIED